MSSYAYDGYLWPSFLAMLLIASLGWHGWRHRKVPGALPFTVACLFGVAWSFGTMLESAALDPDVKVFWLRFATLWQLPLVTAATCFVLQYAGLNRWLTRRTLILLAVPPLLVMALILTDGLHHLAWTGFSLVGGGVDPTLGPALSGALAYSYLLFLLNIVVLLWLFVRSPRHRGPVALMVLAQVGARILFEFGVIRLGFPRQWDPDPFVLVTTFGLYAVVLFRFHVLDPISFARPAALDQMKEGIVVVDVEGRIVDANPSAERTLGESVANLRARTVSEVLPIEDVPAGRDNGGAAVESEFEAGSGAETRHYVMEATPLKDRRGHMLGRLLLLHDVTGQRRAQERLLEQERVVATLQERERLARELHDSVGQILGYLSLQAQTVRKRMRDGDTEKADFLLSRLTDVAQHAHADVRESILALRAASSKDWSFLPTLGRYLHDFRTQYGVRAELAVGDGVTEETFPPNAGVQLLRVIQEALTNARRHGCACSVCVAIELRGDQACITVSDDGCGFDPALLQPDGDGHFGLTFMRERMAQIAGSVTVDSRPGAGTCVRLLAPVPKEQEAQG